MNLHLDDNSAKAEILAALRQRCDGMTRNEIRDHFGRHHGSRLSRELGLLQRIGLAHCRPATTGGPARGRADVHDAAFFLLRVSHGKTSATARCQSGESSGGQGDLRVPLGHWPVFW